LVSFRYRQSRGSACSKHSSSTPPSYWLVADAFLPQLNPRRLVTIIHFPIRVVRLITDPIVDLVVAFARAAVARLFAVVRPDQPSPTSKVWSAVGSPMLRWFQNPEFSEVEVKAPNSNTFFKDLWRSALNKLNQFKATPPPAPTSAQDRILAQLSHIVRYAEEHVSSLRQSTQEFLASFREQFELLTIGNGPRERVFAVILGYIAFVICAAVYVNNAEPRGLKGIAGIIRTTIIQQVIVLKV
jgi:E3 ubiquitin-protein ligase MARCH6